MKTALAGIACRLLIASLLFMPVHGVRAGMISTDMSTDRVAAVADAQSDRAAVRNLLGRADVAGQLRSLGVDQTAALERVAAMTDAEVRALAGNIASLPAGAANGWTEALVIILIGLVIYYNWK